MESGSKPMNENRPDSSFFSADSKRKQGSRLPILAKADTGVSLSATRSTISGMRLPRLARRRNSSREGIRLGSDMGESFVKLWSNGVIEQWSNGVLERWSIGEEFTL